MTKATTDAQMSRTAAAVLIFPDAIYGLYMGLVNSNSFWIYGEKRLDERLRFFV